MTARPSPSPSRHSLAYEVRTSRIRRPIDVFPAKDLAGNTLSIQLPTLDRAEAAGVRPVDHGVWSLLARLPDGRGSSFSVLARLEPVKLEGAEPPALAAAPAPEPAAGLLELRGVVLRTEFPAGSVVEAAAASGALEASEPLNPADLRLTTGLVPGARACCLLQEAYVKDYEILTEGGSPTADPEVGEQLSGLRAEVGQGGVLELTWTATPAWDVATWSPTDDRRHLAVEVPTSSVRQARVVPAEGTRLVVLSRLEDGRSAGVLVRFRPEGDAAPR